MLSDNSSTNVYDDWKWVVGQFISLLRLFFFLAAASNDVPKQKSKKSKKKKESSAKSGKSSKKKPSPVSTITTNTAITTKMLGDRDRCDKLKSFQEEFFVISLINVLLGQGMVY